MPTTAVKLIIDVGSQHAELLMDGKLVKKYTVSTSSKGLGCETGSYKTPTGLFAVAEKIGSDAVIGTVFKSRIPTGEIWSAAPTNPLHASTDDLILTRILWLEGRETHNANTKDRYIYIHGTNREDLLGTPASCGCIRVSNKDVVALFDQMPLGTLVEIRP